VDGSGVGRCIVTMPPHSMATIEFVLNRASNT
jgi:hypothetical protein